MTSRRVRAGGPAFLLAFFLGAAALADPPDQPVVGVITATSRPVYQEQKFVGRIKSPGIVQLQARVTGYLEQQNFQDGDPVKKGELLYVIEQAPYQAAVAQAQAQVAQAQATAHNSNLVLGRAQALIHTPAGQQSVLDSAKATALSDQAAILVAEAQLKTAQINLGYTEIRAPIDGVIGATSVTVGNVVGPNSGTLATIVSENPMWVTFGLPAVDALKLRDKVDQLDLKVELPDGSLYGQTGHVDFINNQVTADTDTLTWRGTIPDPDHVLTDGEFITAVLRARQPEQKIVLPLGAIVADQLGDYVLEVGADDIVKRVAVKLGTQTNTSATILSGVKAGDRIVTEGLQRIHPGIKVAPHPADQG